MTVIEFLFLSLVTYTMYTNSVITVSREWLALLFLLFFNFWQVINKQEWIRKDQTYLKSPLKLVLDEKIDIICKILVVPYMVKKTRLELLREVNRAYPGARVV